MASKGSVTSGHILREFGEDDLSDYQFGIMNSPTDAIGSGFPNITTGMVLSGTTGNFSPQTLVADDFSNISSPNYILCCAIRNVC